MLLNAFLIEEKLLVAASESMPLVAAVVSTSASSWGCGIPVLPAVGSVALMAAVGSMPQTQQVKLKKSLRSKV